MEKATQSPSKRLRHGFFVAAVVSASFLALQSYQLTTTQQHLVPAHAAATFARCQSLHQQAGPPSDFHSRKESDRFAPGTKPTLIKNGRIWTGGENGTEVVHGDILLDKGLIVNIGHFGSATLRAYGSDLQIVDADGAWVTPGIVDLHSHLGDGAAPYLSGADDTNSLKGTVQPWLRSVDGLNTHDDSYPLSISGGTTTALILPGSANAIGGQAFPIKLRQTSERSTSAMLLEPPYTLNGTKVDPSLPPRWRHMKHACGENPSRVYGDTRMDTLWAFRSAYNHAVEIKTKQDEFCANALSGNWNGEGEFPEDLQWEALVDVVRGRVKVNVHCYEAVDLDDIVRLTNEFKFPIAAFHHAHEAYLVPEVIKKAYGNTPAVAIFATNARYKREAYRGSEFAARILADNGLTPIMKSDHSVLNSRYLLYEAQQAHYYGLADNLALASVTSHSADVMGMGHRIGYVKKGWDADLVIWDSHPLALGATPKQVFIDGIAQFENPFVVDKGSSFQTKPKVPSFDKEIEATLKYEGLPPLEVTDSSEETVVFTNVKSVFTRSSYDVQESFRAEDDSHGVVVAAKGRVICSGVQAACMTKALTGDNYRTIDLQGGSISPALLAYGPPLGLANMEGEPSTNDGNVPDPLRKPVPKILGGDTALIRAVDGLQYTTRDALLAYRQGVTSAISAPTSRGFLSGLGTWFSTGANHRLEKGAVIQEVTSVHVSVKYFSSVSVSTQIAALRRLLLGPNEGATGEWFHKAANGELPLVVTASSADIIASLILLKKEVEASTGKSLKLTIAGAEEAHLLAAEIGAAGVGVILSPPRPFPQLWESRRILPGPPLTKHSAVSQLMINNVTVAIGNVESWSARHTAFDVAWAALESDGTLSRKNAFAIGSVNLEKLLGVETSGEDADLVATTGGDLLEMSAKVRAIISPRRQKVDLL